MQYMTAGLTSVKCQLHAACQALLLPQPLSQLFSKFWRLHAQHELLLYSVHAPRERLNAQECKVRTKEAIYGNDVVALLP